MLHELKTGSVFRPLCYKTGGIFQLLMPRNIACFSFEHSYPLIMRIADFERICSIKSRILLPPAFPVTALYTSNFQHLLQHHLLHLCLQQHLQHHFLRGAVLLSLLLRNAPTQGGDRHVQKFRYFSNFELQISLFLNKFKVFTVG